ncbi:MAG: HPF/RaiA family ribosome-associated protein [Candidatus Staskawiczbacteria bacterium]|jgi:putative sigma-54 modulation protein
MKILIKTKNLDRSETLDNFIEKKFEGLKKFIDEGLLTEILVEIEKETKHHKKGEIFLVKSQVMLFGKNIMAEERGDDLLVAVGRTRDELKLEIEKYKLKKLDINRREARKLKGK